MSWQISCLEKELGVKLFVRSTRSVNLTNAGIILRDEFTKINDDIDMAISHVKTLDKDDSAIVSIGFFDGLSGTKIIKPLLNYLMQEFPNVKFDIFMSDMSTVRNYLVDGRIDISITTADDWAQWPNITSTILKSYQFEVILGANHPLAQQDQLDLNQLHNLSMFALPHAGINRKAPHWQDFVPRKDIITLPTLNNILMNLLCLRGFACLINIFEGANSAEYKTYPLPFEDARADLLCADRKDLDNQLINEVKHAIIKFFQS